MQSSLLFVRFWRKHPALFYGISLLLGFYSFFYGAWAALIPAIGLWLPFLIYFLFYCRSVWQPIGLSIALFASCWVYATLHYTLPELPKEGVKGTAYLSIQSIRQQRSFFGAKWVYACHMNHFYPDSDTSHSIATHLPLLVNFPDKEEIQRPLAHQEYVVSGKLIKTDQGFFVLKVSTFTPWKVVQNSWSLTELRYQWKKTVQQWIQTHFSNPLSALFLGGLATGDFDDQWLRGEFARFGLQHIMAISGFHFAIIMGIFTLILRCFLSRKYCACILLLLMSSYAFFLGANPSIMRAWMMCSVAIIGWLIEKNPVSLNSLGIALMGVTLYDPWFCQTMGFQFSFLTTAAILLFYTPINHCFANLILKRPLSDVIEMSVVDQHGYCILAFFKQGLALMSAVNLFAFPLTLYYFHQFPLMSLFYNLFFPFLVSISLFLLVAGFLVAWIPFIGLLMQGFNDSYTQLILKFTYGLPVTLDYYLRLESFSVDLLIAYITVLLGLGIVWRENLYVIDLILTHKS